MQTIFAQDKSFSFKEIRSGAFHFEDEYLNDTFTFCKQWLNGQSHFEFNTSGSTGAPTAISAKREHMELSAGLTINALALDSSAHILLCISSKMIGGAMMLVRGLILGCDITVMHPQGNPLLEVAENHPYTFASFVPMQLFDVCHIEWHRNKLERFHHILLGGAAANKNTLDALASIHTAIWQTYGMTETLSHIALRRVGKDTYYKTLPGIKIKTDERSCLCIESELTDNRWLLTNDVVELIDETHFNLSGRIDDVINSGGIKIFSYDVEHAILEKFNDLELPPKPLFVCRKPDDKYGETVVVVMLGKPLTEEIIEAIRDYCKIKLGKYAAPRHFYFVDEFEKLESGKLNKKATLTKILQGE
ncbi:MAG: AMP-binding protein [Bacteroidia bacterium]|jgi:O-succinylbenzoic acid--CoA ligase|nr:AMP-binding protein [Bacteroidia bacterium]